MSTSTRLILVVPFLFALVAFASAQSGAAQGWLKNEYFGWVNIQLNQPVASSDNNIYYITGQASSRNLGRISFNFGQDGFTACPGSGDQSVVCRARINLSEGKIFGYGKFLDIGSNSDVDDKYFSFQGLPVDEHERVNIVESNGKYQLEGFGWNSEFGTFRFCNHNSANPKFRCEDLQDKNLEPIILTINNTAMPRLVLETPSAGSVIKPGDSLGFSWNCNDNNYNPLKVEVANQADSSMLASIDVSGQRRIWNSAPWYSVRAEYAGRVSYTLVCNNQANQEKRSNVINIAVDGASGTFDIKPDNVIREGDSVTLKWSVRTHSLEDAQVQQIQCKLTSLTKNSLPIASMCSGYCENSSNAGECLIKKSQTSGGECTISSVDRELAIEFSCADGNNNTLVGPYEDSVKVRARGFRN